MSVQALASKTVAKFNKSITDKIFLEIQGDPELMKEYLIWVHKHGAHQVNMQIGRAVKDAYQLTNSQMRQESPKSTLTQSHQEFK